MKHLANALKIPKRLSFLMVIFIIICYCLYIDIQYDFSCFHRKLKAIYRQIKAKKSTRGRRNVSTQRMNDNYFRKFLSQVTN